MPGTHEPYPPEFRRRMVELVRPGRSVEEWRGSSSPQRVRSGTGSSRLIWTKVAAVLPCLSVLGGRLDFLSPGPAETVTDRACAPHSRRLH